MKAVSFNEYGSVDVLQIIDASMPTITDSQVLVKIKVAGLNPGEISIREGYLEQMFHTDFPSGEGTDFAGVITDVGSAVTDFKVGDEVLGYTHKRASHAEYAAVKPESIILKPSNVSWEVAGSLFVAGTTAYAGIEAVKLTAGETVVVSGAAGGVGIITAQLAVLKGAKVIGIASPNYHDWLNNHGITSIDYHGDVKAELAKVANKIDALIDTVGGGYVELVVTMGIPKARINTCIDFEAAGKYEVSTAGSDAAGNMQVMQELVDLIADGTLEVPIARSFELDQVHEAYNYLANNHDLGKVIFTIS